MRLDPTKYSPAAVALAELMSEISESQWAAGWLINLEYHIWAALKKEDSAIQLTALEAANLETLCQQAGGWIRYVDGYGCEFIPLTLWTVLYARDENRVYA